MVEKGQKLGRRKPRKVKKFEVDEWYTTAEAAEILGITLGLARRYCRAGRLKTKAVGRYRLVYGKWLAEFVKVPRRWGRPPKRD